VLSVPVLDVGGTHVTGALVDTDGWRVAGRAHRLALDGRGGAAEIIATLAEAANAVEAGLGAVWGVAMPDPFDYAAGVALFEGVGKFDAINGVDIGAALAEAILARPAGFLFLNDAEAFLLGEWVHGAASGYSRAAGLTLGTGVGSASLADGVIISSGPGMPRHGRAHWLRAYGKRLEDVMSRRAIRAAYAARTGDTTADVREIADRARRAEPAASDVLAHSVRGLGTAIGPWLTGFGAEVLVVGGSMVKSWDVFEPLLREGLHAGGADLRVVVAHDPEAAALLGAARHVLDS
jgi:glucokinase